MTDLLGWAAVITAVLTPMSVMFLAYLNNRSNKEVKAVAEETLAVAIQVDEAVNGKKPGAATISEDVSHTKQDVAIIKTKQEVDNPSKVAVEKAADDAAEKREAVDDSLKRQVQHLTEMVEGLTGSK